MKPTNQENSSHQRNPAGGSRFERMVEVVLFVIIMPAIVSGILSLNDLPVV